ncbi:hypothetical protein CMI45_01410 [Candidatus Pacearchaeota archaeon]|nr:hypothetical protein [Candidatus Pacearchaeota archaeon]|tara:strand:+ start:1311 stop:1646 length:336 start_codon:yes stop_codon:yes gene_type:complete
MAKKAGNVIGGWAFLIGVVLALVLGFLGNVTGTMATILVVVGVIIGLLNIADKESAPFLMSGAVLVIVSSFGQETLSVVTRLSTVVDALLLLFVPATIVVAIRHVLKIAKR